MKKEIPISDKGVGTRIYFLPILLIIFCLPLHSGYANGQTRTQKIPRQDRPVRLPGIDSTIVEKALLETKTLFVSINDEQNAKSRADEGNLAFALYRRLENLASMSASDSLFASVLDQLDAPDGLKDLLETSFKTQGLAKAATDAKSEGFERLLQSKRCFDQAHMLNRFDVGTAIELAQVDQLLGQHAQTDREKAEYLDQAVAVLNRLLETDKGNHFLYFRIGEIAMIREDWKNANDNFGKAYRTLRTFEFLPRNLQEAGAGAVTDSVVILKYLNGIIQSSIRLRDSDAALRAIEQASGFVQNEEASDLLNGYRQYINWANGDLLARELYVNAQKMEEAKDYANAAEKYQEVLARTQFKSENAFRETAFALSMLEYQHLLQDREYTEQHPSESIGMNRLRNIIRRISKDPYGAPTDTSCMHYFNAMGTMLYNEGILALKANDNPQALAYFLQGALMHSKIQVKCCFYMGRLTVPTYPIGFKWALLSYSMKDQLTSEELSLLFRNLRMVSKLSNNPVLCRYFNDEFRSNTTNLPSECDPKTTLMSYEFLRSGYQSINRYLWEMFRIKPDPAPLVQYEAGFEEGQRRLAPEYRNAVFQEIETVYQRMGDSDALDDWKRYRARFGESG